MDHQWPTDGEHMWGKWYAFASRRGTQPAIEFRRCVHPECKEVQYRNVI
jgi:hypothetical protein